MLYKCIYAVSYIFIYTELVEKKHEKSSAMIHQYRKFEFNSEVWS